MERLTFESDGYFAVDGDSVCEDQNENYFGGAIDRLAAYEDTGLSPEDVTDLMGSHAMAICELAKMPKWIPVTERLPQEFVSVLVCIPSENPLPTVKEAYLANGAWATKMAIFFMEEVTHWMPLPEPPKEVPADA